MAIYTSYFGNWRNFPEDSYVISIARHSPKTGFNLELLQLAPENAILWKYKNGYISEKQYAQLYLEQLNLLDKNKVINYFLELKEKYINIILCCYEKRGDFCHRYILAKWLYPELEIDEL